MKTLYVFIIPLLLTGCALYSNYYQGTRSLDKGDYDKAIALFEKALEASPDDPKILTDLGVAYFKKANLQEAIRHLEKAGSLDPTYGKPYPYLGMIYEKQDDFQKAIREYSIYCEKYPLTSTGRHLKARIGVLMRKQIAREIQAAIQQEKSMPVQSIPENTIAVSYFSNLTGDKEWDLFRKGLTDILIIDFSEVRSLKVVERMRMNILMKEMEMGASDLVESSTAPRVGKILGARRIINGGIGAMESRSWRYFPLATAHQGLLAGNREAGYGTVALHLDEEQMRGWYAFDEGGGSSSGGWHRLLTNWTRSVDKPGANRSVAMPHGWAISELWLLMRDCLLFEDDSERVVLLAGIPSDWFLHPDGMEIKGLKTHFGSCDFTWIPRENGALLELSYTVEPPNGFILRLPHSLNANVTVRGESLAVASNGDRLLPNHTREASIRFEGR